MQPVVVTHDELKPKVTDTSPTDTNLLFSVAEGKGGPRHEAPHTQLDTRHMFGSPPYHPEKHATFTATGRRGHPTSLSTHFVRDQWRCEGRGTRFTSILTESNL